MLPVAVDVMGGDRGPREVVKGALQANERFGIPVALVGHPDEIGEHGDLEVWPACEVIEMDEDPLWGVRRKKDASALRAAEAVAQGRASAMVSAGHTGAAMASALLRMGKVRGVVRPALAVTIPVPGLSPTVLLDAGANVTCKPRWMLQFARMGAAYAAHRLRRPEPLVGLLSIGEEARKGNDLVRAAHALMREPGALLPGRFVGNVEGRDVLTDRADVVVTDGFTGNVVLKTVEGSMRTVVEAPMRAIAMSDDRPTEAAYLTETLMALRAELDPESHGGAVLLGIDGVCIISHGSSSARAIMNAVRLSTDLVTADLAGQILTAVSRPEPGGPPR